jgi:hypothetical protein
MAHGHESADKKHGKHGEWIGRKTKEALGAGIFSAVFGGALLAAAGITFPPYILAWLGLAGAGSYAFGARGSGGGKGHH